MFSDDIDWRKAFFSEQLSHSASVLPSPFGAAILTLDGVGERTTIVRYW